MSMNIQAAWESPREDQHYIGWAHAFWAAVQPFSTGSSHINFMTEDEDPTRVRAAYSDKVYTRLREIKASYHPRNLFRGTKNIPPLQTTALMRAYQAHKAG